VALLVGASFWVRQFCVAVFLPLWLASLGARLLRCDHRSVVRSLPAAAGSTLCFAGVVLAYFHWAKASGNYRPEFDSHLQAVWRFDSRVWWLTGFEMAVYLTAFLGPFLCWLAGDACTGLALGFGRCHRVAHLARKTPATPVWLHSSTTSSFLIRRI